MRLDRSTAALGAGFSHVARRSGHGSAAWRTLPIVLLAACHRPVDAGGDPGRETGPCIEDQCLGGELVCLSDLCVDPNGAGESEGSASAADGADDGGGQPNSRDVDILFVIDNSGSMGRAQGLLSAGIFDFFDVLDGAGANWRVGFTTSDNGNPVCGNATSPEAGGLELSSCLKRQSQFIFNGNPPADATAEACVDHCSGTVDILPTSTEFDPVKSPRPWMESRDGQTNLATPWTAADAFGCLAPQGIAGCGFESPLESMHKAILRASSENESQYGFLRTTAMFVVIIVSDETDCSYADKSIFLSEAQGGETALWSDPKAPTPTSAVCWRAGVSCSGGPGTYDECHSENKGASGERGVPDEDAVLFPVSRYIDALQAIEDERKRLMPAQEVLVALIAGVPDGYETHGMAFYADDLDPVYASNFGIGPGCENAQDRARAIPPVREREVAEAFAIRDRRDIYSVCADGYSAALRRIAGGIVDQFEQ